jgi:hypothetical protein
MGARALSLPSGTTTDPYGLPGSRVVVRPAFSAGLAFMRITAREEVSLGDMQLWISDRMVDPGLMPMPSSLYEPGVGTVALHEGAAEAWAEARRARLSRIAATARARVSAALFGLIHVPPDDRFLAAAIYGGRVARVSVDRDSGWRPCLVGNERLSDIVLALFAADVLQHRDDYDQQLCVCEICGHLSFDREAETRTRCVEHPL